MKKLILLLAVVWTMGAVVSPRSVQAQDASDKEYALEWVQADALKGLAMVRFFENSSGKQQYKIEGIWALGSYEIVVNINTVGNKKDGQRYNCTVEGTVYNLWGDPLWCGQNQSGESLIAEGNIRLFFFLRVQGLIVDMQWQDCPEPEVVY